MNFTIQLFRYYSDQTDIPEDKNLDTEFLMAQGVPILEIQVVSPAIKYNSEHDLLVYFMG